MTDAVPRRIRVKSAAPLPEFKIWVSIPFGIETIGKLKNHFCENVCFLEDLGLQSSWLVLELEDYELLDASPTSLLQDGDVLVIKRRITPIPSKRKAERQDPSSSQHKKRKLSVTSISGSSSTSGSSETTSSSSASSSSTSSTSSTTDSSTADSSTNTLRRRSTVTQNNPKPANLKQIRPAQLSQPVPPGLGKSSTHARNKRRKLKRQRQKERTDISLDDHARKQAVHSDQIVEENITHDGLPLFPPSQDEVAPNIPEKANAPYFIPPSERDSLPRNIFVTSIDVEDPTYHDYPLRKTDTIPIVELPSDDLYDWDVIDKEWDTYTKIAASTFLSAGMVVGWRAFGLNPTTLTPEISLLHLGKVIEHISDNIRIAVISRGNASFGGVVVEEEPEEELTKTKESIISEEWRIINHS